jgi:hypothetical protein
MLAPQSDLAELRLFWTEARERQKPIHLPRGVFSMRLLDRTMLESGGTVVVDDDLPTAQLEALVEYAVKFGGRVDIAVPIRPSQAARLNAIAGGRHVLPSGPDDGPRGRLCDGYRQRCGRRAFERWPSAVCVA